MKEKFDDLEFQERLQAYLAGDQNEPERRAFEAALRESAGAQEEYAFSRRLVFALQNRELLEVSHLAKKAAQSAPSPPPSPSGGAGRWWRWGLAALVMLTTVGFFAYSSWQARLIEQEASALSLEYLAPLENLLYADSTSDARLVLGMEAYEQSDYQRAAEALSAYLQRRPDANASLYLAIAQLYNGQAQEARQILEELARSSDGPFKPWVLWYQALACLQEGQIAPARQLLEELETAKLGTNEAGELLERLKTKPFDRY